MLDNGMLRMHQKLKILLTFLFFFCSTLSLKCQSLAFKHYTVSNGLPSTTIYRLMQDSKGFLWISSSNGLTQFDGVNFTNYSMNDGLPDNEVFDLSEDNDGRIWFTTLSKQVGYVENNKIMTSPHFFPNGNIRTFYCDSEGTLWLINYEGHILKIKNNEMKIIAENSNRYRGAGHITPYKIAEGKNRNYWLTTGINELQRITPNDSLCRQTFHFENDSTYFYSYPSRFKQTNQGDLLFHGENFVSEINSDENRVKIIIPPQDLPGSRITCLEQSSNGHIWVGTTKGILHFVPHTDSTYTFQRKYLPDMFISSIIEDRENILWFGTLGNGLYALKNPNIEVFSQTDMQGNANILCLESDSNNMIWLGAHDGKLYRLTNSGMQYVPTESALSDGRLLSLKTARNGNLWLAKDQGLFTVSADNEQAFGTDRAIKDITEDEAGNIWVAYHNGVFKIAPGSPYMEDYYYSRTSCIKYVSNGRIYAALENRLVYYNGKTFVQFADTANYFNYRTGQLDTGPDSSLWVATLGNGVVQIKNGKVIRHLTEANGLISNVCNAIDVSGSTVWVGTNSGLSKITTINNKLSFSNLNVSHGLISNQINAVLSRNDTVWAATELGVMRFKDNIEEKDTIEPPIYITDFQTYKCQYDINNSLQLDHDENTITIKFKGLSFKSNDAITYKYRISPDKKWYPTSNPSVQISGLSPGKYIFEVKAVDINLLESKLAAKIRFEIVPAFWQNKLFQIIFALSVIAVIAIYASLRIKKIKREAEKRTQLNKEMAELKLTALKAQINPHFIFNALNAIQNLIISNKNDKANRYLSKFASLLRLILEKSDQQLISLETEIEMLQLYLEIETFRFSEHFSFSIEVDNTINQQITKIPAMLVQPVVENAIQHGLLPKKNEARLTITFQKTGQRLKCSVIDNGIGRKESGKKENPNQYRQPKGMKLTKERLHFFNKASEIDTEFEITDLKSAENKPDGTKVDIFLPLIY